MTREEAIEYWEQFNAEIDDLYDACSDADRDVLVKQREAVEFTISALREQEAVINRNEPLTLDELRTMDGEPVWVEFQDGSGGCWGLVHITMFNHVVFANGLYCTVGKPYYGKTWLAYHHKPEEDDHG